jgi:hypothetical protein
MKELPPLRLRLNENEEKFTKLKFLVPTFLPIPAYSPRHFNHLKSNPQLLVLNTHSDDGKTAFLAIIIVNFISFYKTVEIKKKNTLKLVYGRE